ncbi:hypothetical protein FEM03_03875 [Phragmitibacter flavus]|uniref:DUF4760 domain-containing protein n=1 Tax=Phragmitibacter flavus TaxID=2576071 RepID=A0A5R8KHT0_9BACT|nr:hypothetical protein [Phragmitibacter flavus]TLD71873.1 hypothetical protein FEM03_03875 [Phragmitibacter flavus]
MDDAKLIAAWIAAAVAIAGTCLTVISQFVFRFMDNRAKRRHEFMSARRDALLKALEVLDHCYSNMSFDKKPPTNPHTWDLSESHAAMNGMIVFCANPQKAVDTFTDALGLRDGDTFNPMERLHAFRCVVCDELGLPRTNYDDPNITWIGQLAGTSKEAK